MTSYLAYPISRRAARVCVAPHPLITKSLHLSSLTAVAAVEHSPAHIWNNEFDPNPPNVHASSTSVKFVKEHKSYMVNTYNRPIPVFVKGHGSFLIDQDHRSYLDFTAGIAVSGLGHSDAGVASIVADQAAKLLHTSNLFHNPWTAELSKALVERTLDAGCMHGVSSVFICNSGTESNEAALKFARKMGKTLDPTGAKCEIVSFAGAFHGRTMGSLSATPNLKYQAPFAPLLPGFRVGKLNDVAAIDSLVLDTTCGVIVEPIQGEGGVNVATTEFLIALAARCRKVGALLIFDEIQCGLSRTGTLWAHAHLPTEAHPDILTTAKALGNGIPVAATLVTKQVGDQIAVGDHGTTFGGNLLACRVAHHVLTRLSDSTLQRNVLEMNQLFVVEFDKLREKYPHLITETRGRGLLLGLQLTKNPERIVAMAREKGLLLCTCGTNTLRFVPPLTICRREVEEGMKILDEAIEAAETT